MGLKKCFFYFLINIFAATDAFVGSSAGSELFSKDFKIVVDDLIVKLYSLFLDLTFASKEVEVITPTPTNAQIVCAINEADEEYV